MSRPEPRPALQRAEDGLVHPAAPRVSPERHLHPAPHAPAAQTRPIPADAAAAPDAEPSAVSAFTGKPVKLDVQIPKDLRKEVRRLAERSGRSLDAVVADALAREVSPSD